MYCRDWPISNTNKQILVESQPWIFGQPGFSHVVFVYKSPLTICPFPPFVFITALGADSNSECSSGSGVLLSDSRETSLAASSVHSTPIRNQGDRERSFRETSFIERDWGHNGERQEERQEQLHGDSNQKSAEAPAQELLGFVGGEE